MTDVKFHHLAFQKTSHTLALTIRHLPERLRAPLSCAYLFARMARTIEGEREISQYARQAMLEQLQKIVYTRGDTAGFAHACGELTGLTRDAELCREIAPLMAAYRAVETPQLGVTAPWINETIAGIAVFARRRLSRRGTQSFRTLEDIERYCYYNGGAFAHLLTDLILLEYPHIGAKARNTLLNNAEDFGAGIFLSHMIRDIGENWLAGRCNVPVALYQSQGLSEAQLFSAKSRTMAHRAVQPLFFRAYRGLDAGRRYVTAIPEEAAELRLFALAPLWLAAKTLARLRDSDALFTLGADTRLPAAEVSALLEECKAYRTDEEAILDGYTALWHGERKTAARAAVG